MDGIQSDTLIFVPPGASCEIRRINIRNLRSENVSLDLIPVVEYSHFDALKQFTNADWVPQTMQSSLIELPNKMIILKQCAYMKNGVAENYFCSDLPVSSYETDRTKFLGNNEYGTWAEPVSLQSEDLPCTLAQNGDNIAALLVTMTDLAPNEERTAIFQLGQVDRVADHIETIMNWLYPANIESALKKLNDFWSEYLSKIQVETPDKSLDLLLNIHNPRQCYTTKTWSRYLSLYQLGYGSRGMGVRDSSQDVMGILSSRPAEARELLSNLLQVQKTAGNAMHQFYPINMEASVGDAVEYPDHPQYYGDDHLWIILATCEYLKETGDFSFLNEMLPYYPDNHIDDPVMASVLDHLENALRFTINNIGKNGLPLLGFADWNDTINLPAGAESMFIACLFGKACLEMIELCKHLSLPERVLNYTTWYQEMKTGFENIAWDGEWFRSYITADGAILGSAENKHGKLYTYGQAWPVIAGFATQDQTLKALDSVYQKLNTKNGIKLSTPGFNGYDRNIGGITTYPPGAKENCGIFVHVNPWVIIAETMNGNGDRAFEYYSQINPINKNDDIDTYEMEPYVFSQNILGDEHPKFGMARNSWLSGTASWMYQAGIQAILGIKPGYNGLIIQPCIPRTWKRYKISRVFRDVKYQITVTNPDGVTNGIKEIRLNGAVLDGNVIPIIASGKTVEVMVKLGQNHQ